MSSELDSEPPVRGESQAFLSECELLILEVRDAIRDRLPVAPRIEGRPLSIYIKAGDGTLLHNNKTYEAMFSRLVSPTGRLAESYLDESIISVSNHSDPLDLAGSSQAMFWHAGRDAEGTFGFISDIQGITVELGTSAICDLRLE